MKLSQRLERHLEERVTVQHQERARRGERGAREQQSPAGAARLVLDCVADRHSAMGRTEVRRDRLVLVADREHEARHALPHPVIEQVLEERTAADRRHRLGQVRHCRAQPGAQSAR